MTSLMILCQSAMLYVLLKWHHCQNMVQSTVYSVYVLCWGTLRELSDFSQLQTPQAEHPRRDSGQQGNTMGKH